jgi:hypothetical protein
MGTFHVSVLEWTVLATGINCHETLTPDSGYSLRIFMLLICERGRVHSSLSWTAMAGHCNHLPKTHCEKAKFLLMAALQRTSVQQQFTPQLYPTGGGGAGGQVTSQTLPFIHLPCKHPSSQSVSTYRPTSITWLNLRMSRMHRSSLCTILEPALLKGCSQGVVPDLRLFRSTNSQPRPPEQGLQQFLPLCWCFP